MEESVMTAYRSWHLLLSRILPVVIAVVSITNAGCSLLPKSRDLRIRDCQTCKTPIVQPTPVFEFEVSGYVKSPGVFTFADREMSLERAIIRAGGADLTKFPPESLFVSVRNRDFKTAVTNFYALPLVTNSAIGQVQVSIDDVIQVVPQAETVFGREQLEGLAGLQTGSSLFRLGTSEEGRDLTIAQLKTATNGSTAAHVDQFVKNVYRVSEQDVDLLVVTRNNWGGVGTARAIVPINGRRLVTAPAGTVVQTSAAVPTTVATPTNFEIAKQFSQSTPSPSTQVPSNLPESQRPPATAASEAVIESLGLSAATAVVPQNTSAPTTSSIPPVTTTASPTIVAKTTLETIEVLGGDVVSVGNSALMPEVLAALVQSRRRTIDANAALTQSNCPVGTRAFLGHNTTSISRLMQPVEKTKHNLINLYNKQFSQ